MKIRKKWAKKKCELDWEAYGRLSMNLMAGDINNSRSKLSFISYGFQFRDECTDSQRISIIQYLLFHPPETDLCIFNSFIWRTINFVLTVS